MDVLVREAFYVVAEDAALAGSILGALESFDPLIKVAEPLRHADALGHALGRSPWAICCSQSVHFSTTRSSSFR